MVIMDSSNSPLADRFFAPLTGIADCCPAARSCPELPDLAWLHLGTTRVLEDEPSGRAFLQSISADWHRVPARSSFFDSLASRRRLRFCREANAALCALMARTLTDPLAAWPGLLVKLYRMRWDIEKVYDEFKNKLLEEKAWATSATAKCMQGEFLCLAHNLMGLHEDLLLREHGIVNEAENRRRETRLKKEQETARKAGRAVPPLRQALQRCTQRTVKFVRWLRVFLFRDAPWTSIVDALRMVYRTP